ncbi:hypothetical protein Tco_0939512 [Tanacetum coccineum]|uniref:Uncharacterized protein n=1 Tax=Tanacetum coccineum TaxID=301880 RepID=A0ABQ5DMP4_9ASTR
MAQLKYCDKHNQVGFLRKPDESAGFAEIVDFLRGSNLRYTITEASIRDTLQLERRSYHLNSSYHLSLLLLSQEPENQAFISSEENEQLRKSMDILDREIPKSLENKVEEEEENIDLRKQRSGSRSFLLKTDQGDTFATPKRQGFRGAQDEQITRFTKGNQSPTKVLSFEEPDQLKLILRKLTSAELNPDSTTFTQVNTGQVHTAKVNPVRAERVSKEKRVKEPMTEEDPSISILAEKLQQEEREQYSIEDRAKIQEASQNFMVAFGTEEDDRAIKKMNEEKLNHKEERKEVDESVYFSIRS